MIQAAMSRIDQLSRKLHGLHADAKRLNPDAIHELRVSSRRLRSAISLFRQLLPKSSRRPACATLKKLTGILGRPREWDVHAAQIDRLASSVTEDAEHAALEYVRTHVDKKRRRAGRRLQRDLQKFDAQALDGILARLAGHRRLPGTSLAELVWPELETRARAALDPLPALLAEENPAGLHHQRIAVKKLRYLLENLQHGQLLDTAPITEQLKRLQEVLGLYHDLDLLIALLDKNADRLGDAHCDVLSRGCFAAAERARLERRAAYAAFQRLAPALDCAGLLRFLRRALGLELPAPYPTLAGAGGG